MEILKIDDTRDNLARMSRPELEIYAKNNGIKELGERTLNMLHYPACSINGAPPPQIVDELRQRGLRGPNVSHRVLGQPVRWADEQAVTRDAPKEKLELVKTDLTKMSRAELAKECKRRGLKMARTDKVQDLIGRLS